MHAPKHMKPIPKPVIPVILLLAVACVLLYFNVLKNPSYVGQAEASLYTHATEVSGKIIESPIQLGQSVKAGDTIAVIDSTDLQYALAQMELSLEKARLASHDAGQGQGSSAQSNIAAAQAAHSSAQAAADQAARDYEKALSLFENNAIPQAEMESAKLRAETSRAALSEAAARLNLARNSTTSTSLSLDMALLENQIAQQKTRIEKCVVKATCNGKIISKNYQMGDVVAPGYNLADIASDSETYLVMYYPKEQIYELSYDQEVSISYYDEIITGVIKYIDVKAQYTPLDLQTPANKDRESVKVKILLPEENPMKPGEQGKVLLGLD